jgi:hypothetical protein
MTSGRYYHTATLLPGGKVLLVGGSPSLDTAELYDPKAGTFSAINSMTVGRSRHTATLLADGSVLVAGGTGSFGTDVPAELYRL